MPTISVFYGIPVQMFFADHAPQHFHIRCGEHAAQMDIQALTVIRGSLPRTASALVSLGA